MLTLQERKWFVSLPAIEQAAILEVLTKLVAIAESGADLSSALRSMKQGVTR